VTLRLSSDARKEAASDGSGLFLWLGVGGELRGLVEAAE
jgi:hypothetical protein